MKLLRMGLNKNFMKAYCQWIIRQTFRVRADTHVIYVANYHVILQLHHSI